MNDDREISCDIGSIADLIDHEPTQFMPGILYYRSNAEDSFDFISFPVLTRPDTRLPESRAGGQGLFLRSLDHLSRSSEAKDGKNPK